MDLFKELFRVRRYKASQGKLVRKLTMIAVWVVFAGGAYRFSQMAFESLPVLNSPSVLYSLAGLLVLFGLWFGYRLINWPTFADFLVAVEAEMIKVSWPSKAELYSSTVVVLVVFFLLVAMIFVFDMAWIQIFRYIKVMG